MTVMIGRARGLYIVQSTENDSGLYNLQKVREDFPDPQKMSEDCPITLIRRKHSGVARRERINMCDRLRELQSSNMDVSLLASSCNGAEFILHGMA